MFKIKLHHFALISSVVNINQYYHTCVYIASYNCSLFDLYTEHEIIKKITNYVLTQHLFLCVILEG